MLPSGYQLIFTPKYWQGVGEGILRQYFGSSSIGGAHLGSNQTCPYIVIVGNLMQKIT
jgi:hypothetical protein